MAGDHPIVEAGRVSAPKLGLAAARALAPALFVFTACAPSRQIPVVDAVPGGTRQGFVRATEAEWTRCEERDDCRVLALGGQPYCVDPRGVLAVRHDSARAARLHYGASDAEVLEAPIQHVTCRPLRAECIDHVCALVEPAP